uniref:Homeobox domain-containing protein n=1 Tax=Steinernema glaseri TaxID=37863 RepID=A0A1I7Z8B0_9BILA
MLAQHARFWTYDPTKSQRDNVYHVKTWFQNRRAKWRRIRKDGEDDEDIVSNGASRSMASYGIAHRNTYSPFCARLGP